MRKPVIVIVVLGMALAACSTAYKSLIAKMPDLSLIEDNVYRGAYDLSSTPIKVILDVVVQNKQITEIKIVEHTCSPVGKKAENIIGQILEHQSLDVDVISGATASSKAILKAVENALNR